jgi:hypothetical protein
MAAQRIRDLEAALERQIELTRQSTDRAIFAEERARLAEERASRAEIRLLHPENDIPPPEIIAAATTAAQGGVVAISPSPNGIWEIHNPSMVLLETAARHLGCCTKTVKRLAKRHGVPISHEGGPRVHLRKLIASMEEAAA